MYNNSFVVDMVLSHSSVARGQLVFVVGAKHHLKAGGICLMMRFACLFNLPLMPKMLKHFWASCFLRRVASK